MLQTPKSLFLMKIANLYKIGNISDHEDNPNKEWSKPIMAFTVCNALDGMLRDLVKNEVITEDERQHFYDALV